ncbi:MAG TPA: choice-of-anchor D domain-containing protein [Polyangia bacterium]|nr:choice-of-anchor D domain-containing protein [Polyangia bacterium]
MERAFYGRRAMRGSKPLEADAYDKAMVQWRSLSRVTPRQIGGPAPTAPTAPMSGDTLELGPTSSLNGTVWSPIGPSAVAQGSGLVNGRTAAIAINPNNPKLIYQGSEGGGLWRTIDGGTNWAPLYDAFVSLGIGEPSAVAIDPNATTTIYVGTSGRFVQNISKGILKSVDGGGSWIVLGSGFPAGNTGNAQGQFSGQFVNSIIVDPANSNTLYLAASNGLFRSINGGRDWTRGTNGFGDGQSLVLDTTSPTNARILWAGKNGVGVFQSSDGGGSWTQRLSATTPAVQTALAGGGMSKVVVRLAPATSPPNAAGVQVLYVTMGGNGAAPDPVGLFLSTDQGANWTARSATGIPGNSQGGFSIQMDVDSVSPGDGANDILYMGTVGIAKSTDSGNNFSNIGNGIHVDFHAEFKFLPPTMMMSPSIVFAGNDGGFWRSDDGGGHWTGTGLGGAPATVNAGGIQTTLFYNLDVRNDATASVTIGTLQDNGVVRRTSGLTWTDTVGGDGWDVAYDAVNLSTVYNTGGFYSPAPCTRMFKSTNDGASYPTEVTPWGTSSDAGCYLAPLRTDPSTADIVYVSGSQNLWQSTDGGSNWRIVNAQPGAGQIDVARANGNYVAHISSNGVFVSTNALAMSGVTFTNITRNLPARGVSRVAFDPNDPTIIFAVMTGFNSPGNTGHVFRTTVGGTAWTDISPTVDVPYNAIVLDGNPVPSAIYVGTDLGVLRSVDDGVTWSVLDDIHLPVVPVNDLALNAQAGVLRASTFGRGVFEFAVPPGPSVSVNAEDGLDFGGACSGTKNHLLIQVFNTGTKDLIVNSVQRLMGSTAFTVLANPKTPVLISPNSEVDFTVQYTPTGSADDKAIIRIASNDPAAPYVDLTASAAGVQATAVTLIADSGNFGNVCQGSFKDLDLTITNSGSCDLIINSIVSSAFDFKVANTVSFPLVVPRGETVSVPIRFQPTTLGTQFATITINTNVGTKTVNVSGNAPPPKISATGSTDFGAVCAGEQAEKTITICDVGMCTLSVTSVAFNPACADFTIVSSPFPASLAPGACLDVVIRFTPTSGGAKSCTLQINSNDPNTPITTIPVTGNTPAPMIDVALDQAFPPTVVQTSGMCTTSEPFPIANKGTCGLTINNVAITVDSAEYSLFDLPSLPLRVQSGQTLAEGDLKTVFGPQVIDRNRVGQLTVTYVSDPITGATTNVTRALCGEAVMTGARVLATAGGVPLPSIEAIQIQRITGNRNKPIVDTVDNSMNLNLQTVTPTPPCQPYQFHKEYGTVSNPIELLPGSYDVTVTAIVAGKRTKQTVSFDIDTCGFNPTITVQF